jgi:uncharacterized repeat protein (TIGR01451 family)
VKSVTILRYLGLGLFVLACGICFANSNSVSAATITVNTLADEVDWAAPNANCSYREAVASVSGAANFGGCIAAGAFATLPTDQDTVLIPTGIYNITYAFQQISIGGLVPNSAFTFMTVPAKSTKLLIKGDPSGGTILHSANAYAISEINNFEVTFEDLTFENAQAALFDFQIVYPTYFTRTTFKDNNTALYRNTNTPTSNPIVINDSLFQNNSVAISNFECDVAQPTSLYVNNSIFLDNIHAIESCGHAEVRNSFFQSQVQETAGSVHIYGTATGKTDIFENNTFYNGGGNSAVAVQIDKEYAAGGATNNATSVILRNNTFFQDRDVGSNGLLSSASLSLKLYNNLFVDTVPLSPGCGFISPALVDINNLSSTNNCAPLQTSIFPLSGISPLLATSSNTRNSIGNAGLSGKTQSLTLTSNSPALDSGDNTTCTTNDQNGTARPQEGNGTLPTNCDVGSVERAGIPLYANVFDPPSAYKTVSESGEKQIEWKMVWINDGNITSELVNIEDPISVGLTYVPGSLVCVANGASVQQLCTYNSATNKILWNGFIASDPGGTTEANTLNEVVITFKTNYVAGQSQFTNQAIAYWDENQDAIISNLDPNRLNNNPITTDGDNSISGKQITVFSKVLASTGFELANLINAGVIFVASAVILVWVIRRRRSR